MRRAADSGGWTHIRYQHRCRPRLLHVTCPSCGAMAAATKPSEPESAILVGDLAPSWCKDDWEVTCYRCTFRACGLAYETLPSLYFSTKELSTWAWNEDHLLCLIRSLEGQDTSADPYHWLMTYIPGLWKRKKKKSISALRKMHLEHSTNGRLGSNVG